MKQNLGVTGKCAEFLVGRLSRSLIQGLVLYTSLFSDGVVCLTHSHHDFESVCEMVTKANR